MSAMTRALTAFWQQRTSRERVYLTVMGLSVGLFVYVFLLLAPLRSLAVEAGQRHAVAQAEKARFAAVLAELTERRPPPDAVADAAALLGGAAAAGLVMTPDATAAAGRVTLRFESAPPQALFEWLAQVRGRHGLTPVAATLRRGPAGLDGKVTFVLAGP